MLEKGHSHLFLARMKGRQLENRPSLCALSFFILRLEFYEFNFKSIITLKIQGNDNLDLYCIIWWHILQRRVDGCENKSEAIRTSQWLQSFIADIRREHHCTLMESIAPIQLRKIVKIIKFIQQVGTIGFNGCNTKRRTSGKYWGDSETIRGLY